MPADMKRLIPLLIVISALSAMSVHAQAPAAMPEPAQIGISPQLFELTQDDLSATHAYRLHNLGRHDTRVRIRVSNFGTNDDNHVVLLPPSESSLDRWLVINPLTVDLPAGETRAVRFSIRPPRPLTSGEHRVAVIFEEDPIERELEAEDGMMALRARFRITSAVYASVGAVERSGRIEHLGLSEDQLRLTISATGNGHVRVSGRYRVEPLVADGVDAIEGDLPRTPVLPGDTRTLIVALPNVPPGRYQVLLDGKLGDQRLAYRQELVRSEP